MTNDGVFKPFPNNDGEQNSGVNGCPISGDIISTTIVGDTLPDFKLGSTIATTPPLTVGTDMISGQSCGYEGTNVSVKQDDNDKQLFAYIDSNAVKHMYPNGINTDKCGSELVDIKSLQLEGYIKGKDMGTTTADKGSFCVESNLTSMQGQIEAIIDELETLGQKIASAIDQANTNQASTQETIDSNKKVLESDIYKYKHIRNILTGKKDNDVSIIEPMSTLADIEGRVADTSISVAQANYVLFGWSVLVGIIAIATVRTLAK